MTGSVVSRRRGPRLPATSPPPAAISARRLVDDATRRFRAAGIDTAALDARVIIAHMLGIDHGRLVAGDETPVDVEQRAAVDAIVVRRAARQPLAQIIGEKEFWSLPFAVTGDVLTPRPDSETLIDAALRAFAGAPPRRILDLGTGSGCLLLALLSEWPHAIGHGLDISAAAVNVARRNAETLALAARTQFTIGDWDAAPPGPFALIVANPPYVRTAELAGLAPEVRDFEPALSLDGGPDGLAAYRRMLPAAARRLAVGGRLIVELDPGLAEPLIAMAANGAMAPLARVCDVAGRLRCLVFAKSQQSV